MGDLLYSFISSFFNFKEARSFLNKTKNIIIAIFIYKKVKQHVGYRLDLIINDIILLEIKSIESLAPVHFAQTLTYLKLSNLKLGLLINFNSKLLKDNIHRIVNNL